MSIKSQAKTQFQYMQVHKGKAIGSGIGLTAGILYGLSNAKGKWGVVGFAILGLVGGGIVGGLIHSNAGDQMQTVSNGDSNQSSFRGFNRRAMEVNRPHPRGRRQYRKRTLQH